MRPTKYEKETILNFNEGEKIAYIFTYNASLKRRLALFCQNYPEVCTYKGDNGMGGVTYEVQRNRVSIKLNPPYSEERIARLRCNKINTK